MDREDRVNYRYLLVNVTRDRNKIIQLKKELLSIDRVKSLKMITELQAIISVQDNLINLVSIIEGVSVSSIREEFNFSY